MTELTLQPNEVETAWAASPSGEKRAEKEERRVVRGRSSLTTTHARTHERSTPLLFSCSTMLASSLQQWSTVA